MSVNLDASGIGQLAIRLGLVSEDQVRDCLLELDDKKAPADQMVRLMERKGHLTPWQGRKLLKGDTDGYVLGGYKLLYKIASGSFGRVYRGTDSNGQLVAVKVLRNKWTMDKQKVDLFMREGKLGLAIRHPNIVSVLAVNQDAKTGQYFLVMEFVEGGNLRDLINIRKRLDIDEALRIMEDCASGLQGASLKSLTHRDIKPTNILISSQGEVKLVDFGLAEITLGGGSVHLQRQTERDDDVAVDRTVDYAGLEKATNVKPGDVRSDIYFLGTVLYEMVTGEPLMPVTKDRQARMLARRYQDVEDTLAKKGAEFGLPGPLQKLLVRMVAYEPKERFQTPAEMLEAVRQCRADLGGNSVMEVKSRVATGPRTLFVIEQNEKLKESIRDKFKEHGYRVLVSGDPGFAVRKFQEQPYHALIIDARTVGEDGVDAYNRVLRQADNMGLDVGAILILSDKQTPLIRQAREHRSGAVLVDKPDSRVTMKQLIERVYELTPSEEPAGAEPAGS